MLPLSFHAMVLREEGKSTLAAIESLTPAQLPDFDTLVEIDYSTLNYKDALAVTGRGKIVRTWPLVPGIDFAGTIVETTHPGLAEGMKVVLTGWSVGEKYWGGYSEFQRVRGEWLVPLPGGLSARQAMMIGTAGFTGMLCVNALEEQGVRPESGPVLVTGAAGGVGSVATAVLSHLGYEVHALTGDALKAEYVRSLGACSVLDDQPWREMPRPLETQRWAAAIDTVGSKVLARVLAEMNYGGVVAACGLAGGADLPTSVMPFILRGARLIGVDSVMLPTAKRIPTWQRIVEALPVGHLERIAGHSVPLAQVVDAATQMLDGHIQGRVLVQVKQR